MLASRQKVDTLLQMTSIELGTRYTVINISYFIELFSNRLLNIIHVKYVY